MTTIVVRHFPPRDGELKAQRTRPFERWSNRVIADYVAILVERKATTRYYFDVSLIQYSSSVFQRFLNNLIRHTEHGTKLVFYDELKCNQLSFMMISSLLG